MLISRPRLNFTRLIFIHKNTLGSRLSSTVISIWYDKLSDSESLRGWKGNGKPVKSGINAYDGLASLPRKIEIPG